MIWFANVTAPTGYAEASRLYLKALSTVGYKNLAIKSTVPLFWNSDELSDPLLQRYRGVDLSKVDQNVILIHADPTSAARNAVRATYNICLTTWETDRLPGDARFALNGWFKEVWVPSKHNEEVFKRSGVSKKLRVIPHAVSSDVANLDLSKFEKPADIKDCYVFYYIGSRNARKNPQAALRAYLSEFSINDPVVFIYKSWAPALWNEQKSQAEPESGQQEVERLTAELGKAKSDAPRVISIDRPLSRYEILKLHAFGDCYVSSHRGEGFGLSMLEARALGRPVIATAYGGPNDFLDYGSSLVKDNDGNLLVENGYSVSTSTDIGIPYVMKPVSEMSFRPGFDAGQNWAEPDEAALRTAMRTCFEEKRRNVGKGRTEEFSLQAVGKIAAAALDEAHQEARSVVVRGKSVRKSRVVQVTTFNEHCGIANYSEIYARSLSRRGWDLEIWAPVTGRDERPNYEVGIPYRRSWTPGCDRLQDLEKGDPGILHIQHEFSFWLDDRSIGSLLRQARSLGWKTAVTCHTILPPGMAHADVFKTILREADVVCGLNNDCVKALHGWAEFAKKPSSDVRIAEIVKLDHPCDFAPIVDRDAVRTQYNLTDKVVGIVPGFVGTQKRLGDILIAVEQAIKQGVDRSKLRVVCWGEVRNDAGRKYLDSVAAAIQELALGDVVVLGDTYLPKKDYEGLVGSADFAILYYGAAVISASAAACDVLRFGLPSVSASVPALSALCGSATLKANTADDLATGIRILATDNALRDRMKLAALAESEKYDPDMLADSLEALYMRLGSAVSEKVQSSVCA